ncbi:MAG: Rid family detoxifying hydrolase [Alistipes sp.]|jgi:2-iminobutanoate/2-iminopropanoate deaminase|nr:Rid family detoxifying hydrolase [Alistipes sp.]
MKKTITTPNAPAAVGPYSQAVEVANTATTPAKTLYISGQIPLDPATGKMREGIESQTEQVFANIEAILTAAGYTFADVVKCTVLLADIADFATVNAIYARHFIADMPARAAYQVAALPMGARVEIETIAAR